MKLRLPDCQSHGSAFTLSPQDRRELVRRIAAEGAGAIDAFIKEREAAGDSLIARKVQALREELMRRAAQMRERLQGDHADKDRAAEEAYHQRLAQLQGERDEFSAQLKGMSAKQEARLRELLRGRPGFGIALDASAATRIPWYRRAWRAFVRFLKLLLFPLLWVLRKLFPPPKRHRKEVLLTFPAGNASNVGDLYLADAGFRAAVRSRLRQAPPSERARRMWERMLGREDYETLAQRAMDEMLAEEAERAKQETDRSREELERALREVEKRERSASSEREELRRALREQEAREMKALEERLRRQPEEQVKEAIVDELKAAGLLKETGGSLLPTIQFMDRFAALVYKDEIEGAAAGRGASAGELAEGEGLYLRGPLRSQVEIARMDIPQSLLRARSRHPHVRRMTEDDIVVHREDRAQLTHVVLIVDRSGSMEDNGRMDAAKRAALALHHAVRQHDRRNPVDVLLMDTSVTPASLREVWEAKPRAFTNHGAALRVARQLIERRRAGRSMVYLVTDGLPEAYTKEGEDVAGHPDRAMKYAKAEASRLAKTAGYSGMVMLLLEPEDERFVKAAEALAAEAGGGRVVAVDPQELARTLVRQFEGKRAAPVGAGAR